MIRVPRVRLTLLLMVAAVCAAPAFAQGAPGEVLIDDKLEGSTTGTLVGSPPPVFVSQLTAGPPAIAAYSSQGLYDPPGAIGAAVAYNVAVPSAGTLSFWLTVAAPASSWGITGVFGREGVGANVGCDDFFMQTSGSALDFGMYSASGGASIRNTIPVTWTIGEVHHVVVSWGPGVTPTVYLDDVANQTTGTPGSFIPVCGDAPFLFAADRASDTNGPNSASFIFDDLLLLNHPFVPAFAPDSFYVSGGGQGGIYRITVARAADGTPTSTGVSLFATTPGGLHNGLAFWDGKLYFASAQEGTIYRYSADGTATVYASGFAPDFYGISGLTFDCAGNLMVSDATSSNTGQVWVVPPGGGAGPFAQLLSSSRGEVGSPLDTIVSPVNGDLFVADWLPGKVERLSGCGGLSTLAQGMNQPAGIALDGAGNVYVSEHGANQVTRIDPQGNKSVAIYAAPQPEGLVADSYGFLYVALNTGEIVRFDPTGAQATLATIGADADEIAWVPASGTVTAACLAVSGACNQPPVAKCQDLTLTAGATCGASGSVDNGSFDPDAGDTITLSQSPAGSYGVGSTPVTLTATDSHGASSSCSATVTVQDTTLPVIGACAGATAVECSGALTPASTSVSATDNCGAQNLTWAVTSTGPSGTGSTASAAPAQFALGTTQLSFVARDASNNQSAACAAAVTVQDSIAPVFTACPAPATVECTSPAGAAIAGGFVQAIDACTTPVLTSVACSYGVPSGEDDDEGEGDDEGEHDGRSSDSRESGGCGSATCQPIDVSSGLFPFGTTAVVFTASDGVNASTCPTAVTVADTTPPTITCPEPTTVQCQGERTDFALGPATATDDCSAPGTIRIFRNRGEDRPEDGHEGERCEDLRTGPTTVRYTARDAHGLRSSCNTTVNVIDTIAPVVTCANRITVKCAPASGKPAGELKLPAAAEDSCDGRLPVTAQDLPSVFPVGVTPVTFSATDHSGNVGSCTTEVEVLAAPPTVLAETSVPQFPNLSNSYLSVDLKTCISRVETSCETVTPAQVNDALVIEYVGSDEPQSKLAGDDIIASGPHSVRLRAQHGPGDGRVYTVGIRYTNPEGALTRYACKYGVPTSRTGTAVDSGLDEGWKKAIVAR